MAEWVLMPVEPTDRMWRDGSGCDAVMVQTSPGSARGIITGEQSIAVWQAMLAARPDPLADEALVKMVAQEIDQQAFAMTGNEGNEYWRECRAFALDKARAVLTLLSGNRHEP